MELKLLDFTDKNTVRQFIQENDIRDIAQLVQLSPYYETLFEKAANFGGRITKEHAFVDGNKRTGYSYRLRFFRTASLPNS